MTDPYQNWIEREGREFDIERHQEVLERLAPNLSPEELLGVEIGFMGSLFELCEKAENLSVNNMVEIMNLAIEGGHEKMLLILGMIKVALETSLGFSQKEQ